PGLPRPSTFASQQDVDARAISAFTRVFRRVMRGHDDQLKPDPLRTAILTYEPIRLRSCPRSPQRRRRRSPPNAGAPRQPRGGGGTGVRPPTRRPPAANGGGEANQARPAHLVALLDCDRMLALAQMRRNESGESGSGRSRGGILGDAEAGREHAGVEMV